jgi:hypothetical protein
MNQSNILTPALVGLIVFQGCGLFPNTQGKEKLHSVSIESAKLELSLENPSFHKEVYAFNRWAEGAEIANISDEGRAVKSIAKPVTADSEGAFGFQMASDQNDKNIRVTVNFSFQEISDLLISSKKDLREGVAEILPEKKSFKIPARIEISSKTEGTENVVDTEAVLEITSVPSNPDVGLIVYNQGSRIEEKPQTPLFKFHIKAEFQSQDFGKIVVQGNSEANLFRRRDDIEL